MDSSSLRRRRLDVLRSLRRLRDQWRRPTPPPLTERLAELEALARLGTRFNNKVHYRMAFDRRPILGTFCDKYAMRAYVTERVGAGFLPALYDVGPVATLDPRRWPREFVLKPTHGSGVGLIVTEQAPRARRGILGWSFYRIHPDDFDWRAIAPDVERWLTMPYANRPGKLLEWGYEQLPPQVIVEEFLVAPDGGPIDDDKCYVFDGDVACIRHTSHRDGISTYDYFTPTWEYLSIRFVGAANRVPRPPAPPQLPALLDVAKALGDGMDFLRVDAYLTSEGLKIGELTPYPGAGCTTYEPASFDEWLGDHWTLPAREILRG